MDGPGIDFAILTAIEVERKAICAALELDDSDRVNQESRIYWRGTCRLNHKGTYEVVVAQSADMANVDMAILTNDALHHWRPGAALLVGIAASAHRDVRLGDVVVGCDVYYYERGKETEDGKKPEPKIIPADATLWSNVSALPDWSDGLRLAPPDARSDVPRVHLGVIASGEKVIADQAAKDTVTAGHRKILAIEMEAYGFSRAVWQSFERVRHLVIRGICDDGTSAKDDRWHAYAAAAAAGFTKHFLSKCLIAPRALTSRAERDQVTGAKPKNKASGETHHRVETARQLLDDDRRRGRRELLVAGFAFFPGVFGGLVVLAALWRANPWWLGPSAALFVLLVGSMWPLWIVAALANRRGTRIVLRTRLDDLSSGSASVADIEDLLAKCYKFLSDPGRG